MYTAFYGLKEEPFNITPDPRFLYWSQKHQEAFRHLVYSVQSNKGLVVLTGVPGTGKTAILHAVIEHLSKICPGVHIAFLANSKISIQDLFCLIFDEFHLENTTDSKSMYLINLKKFLVKNHLNNEKSVLILDEAQNFHTTILEEIRLLSNMETAAEKLLHIFLVGQPKLLENINTPTLSQLKQRLGMIYNLLPLNRLETELYIHKRLSVAGAQGAEIFTSDALDEIFACAKGLPRLINIICDNALLFGCAANTYQINRGIIRQVAQDMEINTLEESVATDRGLPTHPPPPPAEPRTLASPVTPPTPRPTGQQEPQSAVGEEADRVILRNTFFSREDWENLLRKSPSNDNDLIQAWKKATEHEARQRLRRFLMLSVVLLGLLSGIVGEQLGWWSLRAAVGRALGTMTQQVALPSGTAVAPEAVGGRGQQQQEVPLSKPVLPATTSSNERANAELAVPPAPQDPARKTEGHKPLAPSGAASGVSATHAPLLPSGQPSATAQGQYAGGGRALTGKKVVIVRSGDTLSKILIQEYGEYTKAVVDLVVEANPSLRNIKRLEIGQRLVLPERPE